MGWIDFIRGNLRWLAAGFLLSFSSSWGQTFFISIFADRIMGATGLSDGGWGLLYTLSTTLSAVTMVWAGALTDRFRARALSVPVLAGLALSAAAMAAMGSVWLLIPVIFGLRFFGQGMTSQIALVSMARWFAANRGRALAVAAMGFALGQAALPVIFVAAMEIVAWRGLWLVAAALALAAIPAMLWLLAEERTPQSVASSQPVAGMNGRHWTRSEVIRHPLIWLLLPMLLGPPAWGTVLFFQQVHLANVKGWSHAGFVALFPLFTLASVATTLISGWAIDRFGAIRLISGYMLPFAAGFAVLWFSDTLAMAAVAMVALGLAVGSQATLPAAFWAETYGTRHLGAIKALITAVGVFGSAVGPGISGWLIDRGVDFPHQMPWIVLYFLIAGAMAAAGVAVIRRGISVA